MKEDLIGRNLIPSRISLKEGLEAKFDLLQREGIHTLSDLISALKNNKKLEELSTRTGINENYLVLLRREANSYLPNPVSLNRFSGFSTNVLERLANEGIKNSRHLFDRAGSDPGLKTLIDVSGIQRDVLMEMLSLSDLVRAYGVGPVFARILYDTGIRSIRQFRSYSPQQVVDLYQERTGKKADFTISDIKFSLELVKALDLGNEIG
jgi:hypothetical protein